MLKRIGKAFMLFFLLFCVSVTGVCATWVYLSNPENKNAQLTLGAGAFTYGQIYITDVTVTGGSYASAAVEKIAATRIQETITLRAAANSSVTVDVTFYNSMDVSYYYDEEEVIASDNGRIVQTVSGIEQKEEVPGKTYKTLTVMFGFDGTNYTNTTLHGELNFKFTVDKDSIGEVVAVTAVERFENILNNVVVDDSYQTLSDAMSDRADGSWNAGSSVTYIGNVAGATSGDSAVLNGLFGEEFLSMDLDGDGDVEPITMMIKREDLDNNTATGASYTYVTSSWFGNDTTHTVNGVEMTVYITAASYNGISHGDTLTVYAATFTKTSGVDKWTLLVPLTKGTATANNYQNGDYGTANSFNTDNWESEDGKDMETLVNEALTA